jgi:hypothetical protein
VPSTPIRKLLDVMRDVADRYPDAALTRNDVGNLVVWVDGRAVGWVELMNPGFYLFEEG